MSTFTGDQMRIALLEMEIEEALELLELAESELGGEPFAESNRERALLYIGKAIRDLLTSLDNRKR